MRFYSVKREDPEPQRLNCGSQRKIKFIQNVWKQPSEAPPTTHEPHTKHTLSVTSWFYNSPFEWLVQLWGYFMLVLKLTWKCRVISIQYRYLVTRSRRRRVKMLVSITPLCTSYLNEKRNLISSRSLGFCWSNRYDCIESSERDAVETNTMKRSVILWKQLLDQKAWTKYYNQRTYIDSFYDKSFFNICGLCTVPPEKSR